MLRTSSVILMFALLIALVASGIYYFRDTEGPELLLQPGSGPVSAQRPLQLELKDAGSGLRRLTVSVVQQEHSQILLDKAYPSGTAQASETLSLEGAALKHGPFELLVSAGDDAIYHFGKGNQREERVSYDFDSKPPVIAVRSRTHNLAQGGAGMIVYTVSEEVSRTGVQVGERFFPAYRQPSGVYACLFAFPYDVDAKTTVPKLLAEDIAGNLRLTGFTHYTSPRQAPRSNINISDAFLQEKMPNFQHLFPDSGDMLQVFLKVNSELRASNRARLVELSRQTEPEPLWNGAFEREPGANREPFNTVRSYYYQGKQVDRQTHLGIDLASVAQGPIHAENRGRVIFADDFGIYGQCVIIDHGLGLQSLYGHMSSIDVAVGDRVEQGQVIGRTGATGLAGGDHLHLGILVGGIPVNPIEWWDRSWVKNNIDGKLDLLNENR